MRTLDDYLHVLAQVSRPALLLHWPGEMFATRLSCYWGARDLDAALVVGLSLLEAARTVAMRRYLWAKPFKTLKCATLA